MPYLTSGFGQITWAAQNISNGQMMMTSIGFVPESFDPEADLIEAESIFWATAGFGGLTWEGWVSTGVIVKIGTADPAEPITYQGIAGQEGGGTGAPSTPQCSVLVKKLTNRGGRRGRGRMYIPGPQESWVNGGGYLESAGLASYQDALEEFQTLLTDATWIAGIVLLHTDEADGDPDVITSMSVDPKVATQRRRLR